jgi:4-hydroxy-3-methylbut-2-enyl diphosphate reductase IspH
MKTMMKRKSEAPAGGRRELRVARSCGMDAEVRSALGKLEELAGAGGRVAVAGEFMPDGGVSARLAQLGVDEGVGEGDFFGYRQIVIPFAGVGPKQRKRWEEGGCAVTDLSSQLVRRAQVALGLLRMEGAQPLVIGRHDDPETRALAATVAGTRVIEDTTDTARLAFAPAFGVVCQTTLSPRRTAWLFDQLRMRYRDARVTFLSTTAPAMRAREEALEAALAGPEATVVVVGRPGEASVEALAETAWRKGCAAMIAPDAESLDHRSLAGVRRLVLTAGAFATDAAVCAVYRALR